MRDWNPKAIVCGNCQWWLLGNYQHDFEGAEPNGAGGHHCNGEVSECRRSLPGQTRGGDARLSGSAEWPTTRKLDFCGEFKQRGS